MKLRKYWLLSSFIRLKQFKIATLFVLLTLLACAINVLGPVAQKHIATKQLIDQGVVFLPANNTAIITQVLVDDQILNFRHLKSLSEIAITKTVIDSTPQILIDLKSTLPSVRVCELLDSNCFPQGTIGNSATEFQLDDLKRIVTEPSTGEVEK